MSRKSEKLKGASDQSHLPQLPCIPAFDIHVSIYDAYRFIQIDGFNGILCTGNLRRNICDKSIGRRGRYVIPESIKVLQSVSIVLKIDDLPYWFNKRFSMAEKD